MDKFYSTMRVRFVPHSRSQTPHVPAITYARNAVRQIPPEKVHQKKVRNLSRKFSSFPTVKSSRHEDAENALPLQTPRRDRVGNRRPGLSPLRYSAMVVDSDEGVVPTSQSQNLRPFVIPPPASWRICSLQRY